MKNLIKYLGALILNFIIYIILFLPSIFFLKFIPAYLYINYIFGFGWIVFVLWGIYPKVRIKKEYHKLLTKNENIFILVCLIAFITYSIYYSLISKIYFMTAVFGLIGFIIIKKYIKGIMEEK